jgi:hypothetical protein
VGRLPLLVKSLVGHDDYPALRCIFIEPLTDLLHDMQRFQEMVESTLDMDQVDRGEFLVRPSFDDDLQGGNCIDIRLRLRLAPHPLSPSVAILHPYLLSLLFLFSSFSSTCSLCTDINVNLPEPVPRLRTGVYTIPYIIYKDVVSQFFSRYFSVSVLSTCFLSS